MGPWYAIKPAHPLMNWTVCSDEKGFSHIDDDGTAFFSEPEARLIAAAPELLEALKNLIAGAEAMGWNTEKARAAIAKAEGGEQ